MDHRRRPRDARPDVAGDSRPYLGRAPDQEELVDDRIGYRRQRAPAVTSLPGVPHGLQGRAAAKPALIFGVDAGVQVGRHHPPGQAPRRLPVLAGHDEDQLVLDRLTGMMKAILGTATPVAVDESTLELAFPASMGMRVEVFGSAAEFLKSTLADIASSLPCPGKCTVTPRQNASPFVAVVSSR